MNNQTICKIDESSQTTPADERFGNSLLLIYEKSDLTKANERYFVPRVSLSKQISSEKQSSVAISTSAYPQSSGRLTALQPTTHISTQRTTSANAKSIKPLKQVKAGKKQIPASTVNEQCDKPLT